MNNKYCQERAAVFARVLHLSMLSHNPEVLKKLNLTSVMTSLPLGASLLTINDFFFCAEFICAEIQK